MKRLKQLSVTKALYKTIFFLLGLLPKKKKTLIFESFLGKQYSCNPRAIYEYIQTNYEGYTCYWSYDPRYRNQFDDYGLHLLPRFSIKWLLVMSRAKFWISNSRLPLWIPKPKNTIYLQTWHGTPLKKLGVDIEEVHMPGTTTEQYKNNFTTESSRWNYLISPNHYSSQIFTRAFDFKGELIESGYPRNDFLVNHTLDDIHLILTKIGVPVGKKVILYAPTWRDNEYHKKGHYSFSMQLDLEKMQKELGEEYVILMRLHYLVADQLDLQRFKNFAYDVSSYSDIRELYVVADMLITDYSSVFFDYSILKRPMIFFTYDIDTYRNKLRGFYFDLEEQAPGPLVKTTEDVIGEVKNMSQKLVNVTHRNAFFKDFIDLEDGRATERVVKKLLN